MARRRYGRVFRTRAGRLGRYVYRGGRRIGFSAYRTAKRGFKQGARRYIADRTYRYARKRWK